MTDALFDSIFDRVMRELENRNMVNFKYKDPVNIRLDRIERLCLWLVRRNKNVDMDELRREVGREAGEKRIPLAEQWNVYGERVRNRWRNTPDISDILEESDG